MTIPERTATDNWISRPTPTANPRLRLFIFPYAGAGTAVFRNWEQALPTGVDMCVIRLPGRETRLRETPYRRITTLVAALAEVIEPYLSAPFAFYGHSMGALVAFEMAREIRRRGLRQPVKLLVSARRAPQLPDPDAPLHGLSDNAFIREMQRRYDSIPAAILQSKELLDLFLPTLKADFEVIETHEYEAEAPLDFPIATFGGTQDHVLRAGDLEGWREQTSGEFTCQKFVGSHFFIQSQQAAFLEAFSKALMPYPG